MYMSQLDYEVLARQKREAMLVQATRLRAPNRRARTTDTPKRGTLRALVALFRGRLGTVEQPTIGTRAA